MSVPEAGMCKGTKAHSYRHISKRSILGQEQQFCIAFWSKNPKDLGVIRGEHSRPARMQALLQQSPKQMQLLRKHLFPAAYLYCEPSGNRDSLKWKRAKRAGENKRAGPGECMSIPQHGENEDCPQCKTRR